MHMRAVDLEEESHADGICICTLLNLDFCHVQQFTIADAASRVSFPVRMSFGNVNHVKLNVLSRFLSRDL